jgi:hypothetical protein
MSNSEQFEGELSNAVHGDERQRRKLASLSMSNEDGTFVEMARRSSSIETPSKYSRAAVTVSLY